MDGQNHILCVPLDGDFVQIEIGGDLESLGDRFCFSAEKISWVKAVSPSSQNGVVWVPKDQSWCHKTFMRRSWAWTHQLEEATTDSI